MTTDRSMPRIFKGFWLKTRPIWLPGLLIIVGVLSYLYYARHQTSTFYSTAASIIATLYVAIALSVFATKDSPEITFEHWVCMVVSSTGLVASFRGTSIDQVHDVWRTRLLTGLTVAGVTAAVLLVAERLIAWRVPGRPIAVFWAVLFIASAVGVAIFL